MQVQFELTEEDLVHFNLFHVRRSGVARRIRIFNLGLGATALLAVFIYLVGVSTVTLLLGAIAALLYVVAEKAFGRSIDARRLRALLREGSNAASLEAKVVRIDAEGIRQTGASVDETAKWGIVERVAETNSHIFIYVASLAAVVIPKRAFANDAVCRAFVEEVESYRSEARTPLAS